MRDTPDPLLKAVVVVPARDEEERIEGCLHALADQRRIEPAQYEVIVVLDGCTDGTARALGRVEKSHPELRLLAVELPAPAGVGRARRAGMDLACARLLALGRREGLIASTDADSIVASDWLALQLELAHEGAKAIGGLVELDPAELGQLDPQALRARERRAVDRLRGAIERGGQAAAVEHHHFSGASLALTAETYGSCGGLPVRAALEDEALERELQARGVAIHRSRAVRVRTSARTNGRAPRGLARDLASSDWRARRSYDGGRFSVPELLEAKTSTVGLVLPAREVASTIGPIARCAARLRDVGLLDEIIVIDSASTDATARIAEQEGLGVLQENELSTELGPCLGKGDAMWRAARTLDSEIVAFADTDTEEFHERFLTGLLGPLLTDHETHLVKGFFRRPFRIGGAVMPFGGGRVTELMARPLLNLHAPELAVFNQPLAGETALRRALLERLPFSTGYGVEIAMLIDTWRLVGLEGMAQVDLGVRQNRHQSLRELSAMAYAVLATAESRFLGAEFADAVVAGTMLLPGLEDPDAMESRAIALEERPPLGSLNIGTGTRDLGQERPDM